MKIYLIRHTSVDVPKGMCYGQTDVPLNESFEDEAMQVNEKLGGLSPDMIYSSPLTRCTRLVKACNFTEFVMDKRLMELNFGDWERQMWDNLDMSVWHTDWINPPTPNGESFIQMYDRVSDFLDQLKKQDFDTIFIFTHGGVISCARVYFEKADINKTFDLMPKYGEVVQFEL